MTQNIDLFKAELEKRLKRRLGDYEFDITSDQVDFLLKYHPDLRGPRGLETLAAASVVLSCDTVSIRSACNKYMPLAVTNAMADGSPLVRAGESIAERWLVAFGLCYHIKPKTLGEVYVPLRKHLEEKGLLPDEGFHLWSGVRKDMPIPAGRWTAAYGVTGGSEGHWLHVGIVVQPGEEEISRVKEGYVSALREAGANESEAKRYANAILNLERDRETIIHVFSGKTLLEGAEGMDFVYRAAAEIARLLA